MKVLFCGQAEIPARIGMAVRMWELAKNLSRKGHKVFFLCSRRGNEKKFEIIDGIEIHRVREIRKPSRWLASLMLPAMALKAVQICRKEKISIAYGHQEIGAFACIFASKFSKAKAVYDMGGLALNEFILSGLCKKNSIKAKAFRALVEFCKKQSGLIVAVSDFQVKKTLQEFRKKTAIVSNGVNQLVFNPKARKKSLPKPAILHVGLLEAWAGGDNILEAAKIVSGKIPKARFFFLGGGPKLQHLKEKARSKKITNVVFEGQVPYNEVPEFIAGADIGLVFLPKEISMDIAVPLKLFEYLALGKPVVCTKVFETSRIVRQNNVGLVAEPNPRDYAEKIIKLLKDKRLYRKLSGNCRKTALKNTWQQKAAGLEKAFKELLKE